MCAGVDCTAVGKADTSAGLLTQQPTDMTSDSKVSAQPAQLAASYNLGTVDSRFFTARFKHVDKDDDNDGISGHSNISICWAYNVSR